MDELSWSPCYLLSQFFDSVLEKVKSLIVFSALNKSLDIGVGQSYLLCTTTGLLPTNLLLSDIIIIIVPNPRRWQCQNFLKSWL